MYLRLCGALLSLCRRNARACRDNRYWARVENAGDACDAEWKVVVVEECLPCALTSSFNLVSVVGKVKKNVSEGIDVSAVDVPATRETLDDERRSGLSRTNKEYRAPGGEKAVDFAGYDRATAGLALSN
jgi:hypothetical protein